MKKYIFFQFIFTRRPSNRFKSTISRTSPKYQFLFQLLKWILRISPNTIFFRISHNEILSSNFALPLYSVVREDRASYTIHTHLLAVSSRVHFFNIYCPRERNQTGSKRPADDKFVKQRSRRNGETDRSQLTL